MVPEKKGKVAKGRMFEGHDKKQTGTCRSLTRPELHQKENKTAGRGGKKGALPVSTVTDRGPPWRRKQNELL